MIQDIAPRHLDNQYRNITPDARDTIFFFEGNTVLASQNGDSITYPEYRDFIEKEAVKKDFQLSQEYCMILTIRDPEHTAPVYDEVTQQLTNRNFIHHDVRVRNVVHVTNE